MTEARESGPSIIDRLLRRGRKTIVAQTLAETPARRQVSPEEYAELTATFDGFVEYSMGSTVTEFFWGSGMRIAQPQQAAQDSQDVEDISNDLFGRTFEPLELGYAFFYANAVSLAKHHSLSKQQLARIVAGQSARGMFIPKITDAIHQGRQTFRVTEEIARESYDFLREAEAGQIPGFEDTSQLARIREEVEKAFENPAITARHS